MLPPPPCEPPLGLEPPLKLPEGRLGADGLGLDGETDLGGVLGLIPPGFPLGLLEPLLYPGFGLLLPPGL